ncbi:MAG TPA: phage tail sheath C-terminal domain-containing protein [Terriglobales bacterium]|nr:phage tail sheath C-terminal domain-containing protein [Terriglobales bacterium]
MSAFTYPGVYIEELPSGVHTITGVATSIAAFVGWAAQGPTNQATLVQSWTDFQNQFGGLDSRSYLGYAVNQFFANGGQQAYIVRLVSAGGGGSTAAVAASVEITGITFNSTSSPSTVAITTGTTGGLTLSAANPGGWGNSYNVQIQPRSDDYSRFSVAVVYTNPATNADTVVESFPNLSLDPADSQGQYVVNIINEQSQYITASMGTTPLTITNTPSAPSVPTPSIAAMIGLGSSTAGADGTVLNPSTAPSTPGAFETALNSDGSGTGGIHLLDTVPIFNLLCVPGEIVPATISNLQQYCVNERAFLIVDSQSSDTFATLQNGPTGITGSNSTNSAFYFPWVNQFDPEQSVTRAFPPCGFVAGLYAATDASRGVWKAPAGIDASLTGESGLTVALTDMQNGTLNIQAINCLRNFQVYGDVIWGARTLQGNDQAGSQWKYVPIRRLALFLESSLYDGTQWVVFEPNDATLWGQIRLNIGAFMQSLFLQGAFAGTTPQQAYFVKCDADNNPQSSIDQGVVNTLVGFAPLYPAEFVVIQIQQMAGQTQS